MVTNKTIMQRQAITANPVTKLNGFTSCRVETGWVDTR